MRDVNFANVIEYCTDLRGSPRKLKVLGSSSETLPLLLILCGVTGGIVFVLVVALAVIMCAKRTAARQKGNARPGRCHIATQDWRPFGEIKLEIFALTRGAFGFSLIYVAGIVPVFFFGIVLRLIKRMHLRRELLCAQRHTQVLKLCNTMHCVSLVPQLQITLDASSTDAKSGGLPEKTVTLQMTDQNSTANESDLKVGANATARYFVLLCVC